MVFRFLKKSISIWSMLICFCVTSFLSSNLLLVSPAMAMTQDSELERVVLEEVFQYLEQTDRADVTLGEVFQFLDKDEDLNISKEELSATVSRPGGLLKNTSSEDLVEIVDTNKDGYVSPSEVRYAGVPAEVVDLFFQGAAEVDGIGMAASSFVESITSVPQFFVPTSVKDSCGNLFPECGPGYCQAVCYNTKTCSCSYKEGCPGCMTGCNISCSIRD